MRIQGGVVKRSLGARFVTLPLTALCGLAVSKLVVEYGGQEDYAVFTLVVSLLALIPAPDLGQGAVVTDAVAHYGVRDHETRRAVRGAIGVTAVSAAVLAVLGIVLINTRLMSSLLGLADGLLATGPAIVTVLAFAAGIPLSLSFRVLTGDGRNVQVVWLQASASVLTLVIAGALAMTGNVIWVVAAPTVATVVAALLAWVLLARKHGEAPKVIAQAAEGRSAAAPGTSRRQANAFATFVLTIALPLSFQTDRLIISHIAGVKAVAVYSSVAIVYLPLFSLVSSGGQALWREFAQTPAELKNSVWNRYLKQFTLLGGGVSIVMLLAGPIVSAFLLGSATLRSAAWLALTFALLLVVHAVHYPSAMLLTGRNGLAFQAICSCLILVLNLLVSVLLVNVLGSPGAVAGSAIAVLSMMLVPCYLRAQRTTREAREDAEVAS